MFFNKVRWLIDLGNRVLSVVKACRLYLLHSYLCRSLFCDLPYGYDMEQLKMCRNMHSILSLISNY